MIFNHILAYNCTVFQSSFKALLWACIKSAVKSDIKPPKTKQIKKQYKNNVKETPNNPAQF